MRQERIYMKETLMKKSAFLCLLFCLAAGAFAQTQARPNGGIEKNIPSLAGVYKNMFEIGAAVTPAQLKGAEGDLILKHFSSLTAENDMKPENLEPKENEFTFQNADAIVNFALAHKLKVRGHTLVWYQQNPKWIFLDGQGGKVSRDVLIQRLGKYIKTVVGRYRGKIYAWDVVNEPVERKGLRRTEWLDIIGEEYIELAFRFAHEADPQAKLFINEIETTDREKGETLRALVAKLKAKNVPIDGLGMQFHVTLTNPSLPAIAESLKAFGELGVELHVTELDMSLNQNPNMQGGDAPEAFLIRQAHRYREMFDLFKQQKAITSVTFWGIQDGHTWLTYTPIKKADWPLLFDAGLRAKSAYWGLVDPAKLAKDVQVDENRNYFTAVAIKGTPVIDGVEDEVWKKAPEMKINLFIQGQGATGVGKALWDNQNLYVFVKVQDKVLSKKNPSGYLQDSVEIFVDEKNNKSPEYDKDDAQYRINFTGDFSSRGYPSAYTSAQAITADGYVVEVKIPFQFIKPAPGTKIGFDLQINDDPGSGTRESYAKWNDPTNESFRNTSGFGTLILQ
jgi:endo-1,4-beta-xylanase